MIDIKQYAEIADCAPAILKHLRPQRGQALAEHSLLLAFDVTGCVTLLGALGLLVAAHIDSLTVGLP